MFLISLKAGGTGLNLTAASYVVLFDPWWNPAVEAQAIDRTPPHRPEPHRDRVPHARARHDRGEDLGAAAAKAALVRDVLGEESFARGLTKKDLEYLLTEE